MLPKTPSVARFCCVRRTRLGAVRLAGNERHAAQGGRQLGVLGAAHLDVIDQHLLALAHVEADARAGAVGGVLEDVAGVGEDEAGLLVIIEDAAAGVVECEQVHRHAQGELRGAGQLGLRDGSDAGEGQVVEGGARAELHRDAQIDRRRALDPVRRIRRAAQRGVERRDGQRQGSRCRRCTRRGSSPPARPGCTGRAGERAAQRRRITCTGPTCAARKPAWR